MKSCAGEIPEEVLFEILIRLPVKSLCRLRSVCTSWLSVISDPYFIRSHYTSRKLLLMDARPGPMSEWHIYDADHPEQTVARKFPDHWPERSHPSPSVHGLICLRRGGGDDIDILNPSTGENISISLPGAIGTGIYCYYSHHFFGFDPVSKKHKVVYMFGGLDPQSGQLIKEVELWVFTLGSAEKWRRIRVLNSHDIKQVGHGEVCINGVIYFLASTYASGKDSENLAAFDLKSESFQTVKLSFPRRGWWWLESYQLIEFDGLVALVDRHLNNRNHRTINVWVLEDWHKQVWKLKRSILAPNSWMETITSQWSSSLRLACALRGGELLVYASLWQKVGRSLDLFFCDTKNKKFSRTTTHVLLGCNGVMCSDHVESLLPLPPRKEEKERPLRHLRRNQGQDMES